MLVSKSMVRKVITLGENDSVLMAQSVMDRNKIRHLPIVDKDNTLLGIITDRDIRSCLPSSFISGIKTDQERDRVANLKIKEVMTANPITISLTYTLQDALLMIWQSKVGALPVIDEEKKLRGIISVSDLLRSFINVLGIHEPGTLLCIVVEEKVGQMKKIVDAITEENISIGSILVSRHWDGENLRAVFPYLLTTNVANIKKKFEAMGFKLIDPMDWYMDTLPQT